jgi:hypothetical protein
VQLLAGSTDLALEGDEAARFMGESVDEPEHFLRCPPEQDEDAMLATMQDVTIR